MWTSPMGQCVWPGKKIGGSAQPEGREGPAGGLSPQALLLGRGS
jgi:hypothetical protein